MDLLLLENLPEDIVGVIGEFLPIRILIYCNKEQYKKYRQSITFFDNFDNYIRRIIRKDFNFILQEQINNKAKMWRSLKSWHYKNYVMPCYIDYLHFLCIDYESQRCREIIKKNLPKNKHRKIRLKNNKTWSN